MPKKHMLPLCAAIAVALFYMACTKADQDPVPLPPPPPLPAALSIKSFVPSMATAEDTVLIKGNKFNGATTVSFGGVNARSFTIVSDSVIIAVVKAGSPSGTVVVAKSDQSANAAGFTYYTPTTNFLTGSTKYTTFNSPSTLPTKDSSKYKEFVVSDTASFLIRCVNPNKTVENYAAVFADLDLPRRSRFADSPNYVVLSGIVMQNANNITHYNSLVYQFAASGLPAQSSVFARITDTVLTIPSQTPLSGYITISGSGVIKNGVVVSLDYFVDNGHGDTKRASLRKP